jgi:hypothetical protein
MEGSPKSSWLIHTTLGARIICTQRLDKGMECLKDFVFVTFFGEITLMALEAVTL